MKGSWVAHLHRNSAGACPGGTWTSQRWVNVSRHRETPGNKSCRWAKMGVQDPRGMKRVGLGCSLPANESALLQGRCASAGPMLGPRAQDSAPVLSGHSCRLEPCVTLKTKHWGRGAQPHSTGDGLSVQPCPRRAGSSRREGGQGQHPGAG